MVSKICLEAFEEYHDLQFLLCFIVDDELLALREKIEQDHNDLSIRDLCSPRRTGGCDDVFFKLNKKYNEMVLKIPAMKDSRLFNNLWQKYGRRHVVVTVEMLFTTWSKIREKLKLKSQKFVNGEMQLKKIGEYVDMFEMDYKALEDEFTLLLKYFNDATTNLDKVKKELGLVVNKVKCYRKIFDTQQAAKAILELQKALDLQGDFSEIEGIKQV